MSLFLFISSPEHFLDLNLCKTEHGWNGWLGAAGWRRRTGDNQSEHSGQGRGVGRKGRGWGEGRGHKDKIKRLQVGEGCWGLGAER